MKKLRRELDAGADEVGARRLPELRQAVEVKGVKVLVQRVDGLERGQMRTWWTRCAEAGEGVVVLGSAQPRARWRSLSA